VVSAAALAATPARQPAALERIVREGAEGAIRPVCLVVVGAEPLPAPWADLAAAHLPELPPASALAALVRASIEAGHLRRELTVTQGALYELQQVAIALSSERNADTLQQLILTKSRELTAADAGSLYLIEDDGAGARRLRFQLAQNDSLSIDYQRTTMPLTWESLAGYTALSGQVLRLDDVYDLPPDVPYRFNRSFDEATGYRTRSMLMVPMIDHAGEVVGVIQLINRKRHAATRLESPEDVRGEVIPFDDACERFLRSFASQAAVALDNQQLLESIQRLFDGFVRASVQAIESRDPTTSGHSQRVATLSVALGEAANACRQGWLGDVSFSPAELRELRYAGLLHDFGKVGVREHVLVKAKKLYDWQLQNIEERFARVRALLVAQHSQREVEYLLAHGEQAFLATQHVRDSSLASALADLQADLAVVRQVNEPTVLEEDRREQLAAVGSRRYVDLDGQERPLLDASELAMLSIPRGSLTESERLEIESHVVHTVRFLSLIPWTKDLRNVARIAGAHHEKLNGRGYPNALTGESIPVQSRMMTIADIYDALTASDRPYKRAVPTDVALDILSKEAAAGLIDADLLRLFVDQGVYEAVCSPHESPPAEGFEESFSSPRRSTAAAASSASSSVEKTR